MTLFFWEWHLIRRWPLRIIFARLPELLRKDLVSWGSPGECSMIDRFLGDAFEVLSCQFWSIVLQSGAWLPIHTLNYWTKQSVVPGLKLGVCLSVTFLIVDPWQSCVGFIRSDVTRCTLLIMCSTRTVCASAGYKRCYGRTSVHLCTASLQNLAVQ